MTVANPRADAPDEVTALVALLEEDAALWESYMADGGYVGHGVAKRLGALARDAAAALTRLTRELAERDERYRELRAELESAAEREAYRVEQAQEIQRLSQALATALRERDEARALLAELGDPLTVTTPEWADRVRVILGEPRS